MKLTTQKNAKTKKEIEKEKLYRPDFLKIQ